MTEKVNDLSVNTTTREDPPKKAFNTEYETQWKKEHNFLKASGFRPTYVRTDNYGIRTYKYKKTPELFFCIAQFYTQVKYNKEFDELEKYLNDSSTTHIPIDEAKKLVPNLFDPTV